MTLTIAALAALLVTSAPAYQERAEGPHSETASLASEQLADGSANQAIAALEKQIEAAPEDPALLINLGIAHAQKGADEKARRLFERALASPDAVQLETAGGEITDSRRLARKAIRMLERGDFAPQLTRRD